METLLPYIQDWFATKQENFVVFAETDCRLEGWFKGELLCLFTQLQKNGVIENFNREHSIQSVKGRNQIDFQVNKNGKQHLVELKALCISQAAGTPRNLRFYFSNNELGLFKDFRKLENIDAPNRWALAFIYPKPKLDIWDRTVATIPDEFHQWKPITNPTDYPDYLFLSLWKR